MFRQNIFDGSNVINSRHETKSFWLHTFNMYVPYLGIQCNVKELGEMIKDCHDRMVKKSAEIEKVHLKELLQLQIMKKRYKNKIECRGQVSVDNMIAISFGDELQKKKLRRNRKVYPAPESSRSISSSSKKTVDSQSNKKSIQQPKGDAKKGTASIEVIPPMAKKGRHQITKPEHTAQLKGKAKKYANNMRATQPIFIAFNSKESHQLNFTNV